MGMKPDWLYKQSAVIPYIKREDGVEIVLVTSSSKSGWVFPKGVIERFLAPEVSAAKEALEEAGVLGVVETVPVCEYEYEKWKGICKVKVYPLEVTKVLSRWDEMEKRDRKIVGFDEAVGMVKAEQKAPLEKFKEYLEKRNA